MPKIRRLSFSVVKDFDYGQAFCNRSCSDHHISCRNCKPSTATCPRRNLCRRSSATRPGRNICRRHSAVGAERHICWRHSAVGAKWLLCWRFPSISAGRFLCWRHASPGAQWAICWAALTAATGETQPAVRTAHIPLSATLSPGRSKGARSWYIAMIFDTTR